MVAAEGREFDGILARRNAERLSWGLQFACETEISGDRVVCVADGPGMQLAGEAADTARRHLRPDVLVSTGFCGALDATLRAGDVFVATSVIDTEHGKTYGTSDVANESASHGGTLVSVNRVANTAAEKSELRATGAGAVEMEAGAVGARARIWNVPFYCIRGVSDTAGESFGLDFNQMRDRFGRFSRSRIALSALARPWQRVPALVRLNRNCRLASQSLGDFIANCRF